MGQYGAWGYALNYGWNADRILNHFYRGTRVGTLAETGPANPGIDVELTAERNQWGWVTAPSGVDVPGAGRAAAWFAIRVGAGAWDLYAGSSCTEAQSRSTNVSNKVATITNRVTFDPVRLTTGSLATTNDLLRPCRGSRRYRGSMYLLDSQTSRLTSPYDAINATLLVNSLPLDPYLKGVVPVEIGSSAPLEALKAQAAAARSFAAHPSRDRPGAAKLLDSVLDQAYRGFDSETSVTSSAVDSTAGEIRRFTSNGSMAITEYSSSTGGYTAGGTYPAVVDLGDDTFTCTGGAGNIIIGETTADGSGIVRAPGCGSGSARVQLNARHRWRASVPVGVVESSYGVSGLQQLRVDARDGRGEWGGRILGMTIVAASGSKPSSGAEFSSRFMSYGVYSRWFNIIATQPGPTFHVSAAHSGLLLDLPGLGAHSDGVATYFSDGGWDQRWRIVTHSNGEVSFLTHDGALALDVPGNNGYLGVNLRVWAVNWSAAQRFRLEPSEPNEHRIVHPSSGLRLDVAGAGGVDARLLLWEPLNVTNQVFRLVPTLPWKATIGRSPQPTAHVSAAHSGLLLDLPGLGAHSDGVATYFSDGGWDQRWRIVTHPNGEVSFLTHDGALALDVPGNNGYLGVNLRVWAVNWSAAQRFRLEPSEPNEHRIVHPSSGLRLDVAGAGGVDARLLLWEPLNVTNQVFRLVPTM